MTWCLLSWPANPPVFLLLLWGWQYPLSASQNQFLQTCPKCPFISDNIWTSTFKTVTLPAPSSLSPPLLITFHNDITICLTCLGFSSLFSHGNVNSKRTVILFILFNSAREKYEWVPIKISRNTLLRQIYWSIIHTPCNSPKVHSFSALFCSQVCATPLLISFRTFLLPSKENLYPFLFLLKFLQSPRKPLVNFLSL